MKKAAFSLIEILVGLIILSLALAAFAPLMNKKVKKEKTSIASKMTNNCSVIPNCSLCYIISTGGGATKKCISCSNKCKRGEVMNMDNCTCSFEGTNERFEQDAVYPPNED